MSIHVCMLLCKSMTNPGFIVKKKEKKIILTCEMSSTYRYVRFLGPEKMFSRS